MARRHGVISFLLAGLLRDGGEPVPFGTSLVLLGVVHATLLYGRQRFPREGSVFGLVVALLTNLFLFIVLSFLLVGDNPRPGGAWPGIMVDLLPAQLVLAPITPLFLALPDSATELVHFHPETR